VKIKLFSAFAEDFRKKTQNVSFLSNTFPDAAGRN
jgi:hypothetical protein